MRKIFLHTDDPALCDTLFSLVAYVGLLASGQRIVINVLFIFICRLNLDVTWSETGDRYMLKLFRDYLFHTVTEDGRPWLNQSHIVQCLNKLDAGTMEKV